MKSNFIKDGQFFLGANYVSSYAGTNMWSQWDADVVDKDFKIMAAYGLKVLRVFPIWSDFQPIIAHYSNNGKSPVEMRFGEEPLPDDEVGRAGVSQIALEHFRELAMLAHKHGFTLIVSLINGFMSNRRYVPEAIRQNNVFTSPNALKWEAKFISCFVGKLKDCESIIAWELGNEVIWMDDVDSSEEAWVWTQYISNLIRTSDPSRPVLSGMDSMTVDNHDSKTRPAKWLLRDQAELLDYLTVHTYHCFSDGIDPINSMRPLLRPSAMNACNEGIGGKPSFIEEIGSIGYTAVSKQVESEYLRGLLFSLWANNCHGMLWWCAFDQGKLEQTPYEWNGRGSDYGLFKSDRTPKSIAHELKRFSEFLLALSVEELPKRLNDALCILSAGLDESAHAVVLNTVALAKQAGMELEFQHSNQPVKDANIYLLPSIKGASLSRRRTVELLEKVKNGATLYLSMDDCMLRWFPEITGLTVASREKISETDVMILGGKRLPVTTIYRYSYEKIDADVIATAEDGTPLFVRHSYGKGTVFCLTVPLEAMVSTQHGVFHKDDAPDYSEVYRVIQKNSVSVKVASSANRQVVITEHPLDEHRRILVAINYSDRDIEMPLNILPEWHISKTIYGRYANETAYIHKNDALLMLAEIK